MKAILSPWAFLPFHLGVSFPLNKWSGSVIFQLIMLALNMLHYIDEHWTRSFPDIAKFMYSYQLNKTPQLFQYFAMFYFSYYNCGNNKSLIRNWFIAMVIFQNVVKLLNDVGMPKPTVEEQMEAIANDEIYNLAHLVGHCFTFVMTWHVSSVVDVSNGIKKGWIINKIQKKVNEWNGAAADSFSAFWMSVAVCFGTISLAVVIEVLKAANDGSVPFFPPMCQAMVSDEDKCTFMGITIPCFKVFKKETVDHFGLGMEMSAIWTFVVTFLIGFISMLMIVDEWRNRNGSWQTTSLKVTCSVYAMETAFFALIRYYWGVCKPLVVAAAVHNLCEWSIINHMVASYGQLRWNLPWAALFITFLSTLCICIPSLYLSLALEQTFGIMLDFGLPMMSSMQLLSEKRKIYILPATAHTVHLFGTILPLVFGILLSTHVSWFSTFFLEILINVTVPVAHFIYCFWSFRLEKILDDLNESPPEVRSGRRFTTISLSMLSLDVDDDDVPSVVGSDETGSSSSEPTGTGRKGVSLASGEIVSEEAEVDAKPRGVRWNDEPSVDNYISDDDGPLPAQYRIHKVQRYLILGFLLGLVTIGYIPLVHMPVCDAPPCLTQRYVSKTSILTLSDEMLASGGTISDAKESQAGLLDLKLERASHDVGADKFVLVEEWKSKDNMTSTEDTLSRFIDTPASTLKGEATLQQLDVATVQTMTCSSERIVTAELQPQYSCKKLWKVLASPGYCAWVPGCRSAAIKSADHSKLHETAATLYMEGGTTVPALIAKNWKERKVSISVLSDKELPGYSGVITLDKVKSRKGLFPWSRGNRVCNLKHEHRVNIASLSQTNIESFEKYFLPDLYTKLSLK